MDALSDLRPREETRYGQGVYSPTSGGSLEAEREDGEVRIAAVCKVGSAGRQGFSAARLRGQGPQHGSQSCGTGIYLRRRGGACRDFETYESSIYSYASRIRHLDRLIDVQRRQTTGIGVIAKGTNEKLFVRGTRSIATAAPVNMTRPMRRAGLCMIAAQPEVDGFCGLPRSRSSMAFGQVRAAGR